MSHEQKVLVTIRTPEQTIRMELEVPQLEVEDLILSIGSQCEPYDGSDDYDEEEDEDAEDLDSDDFI
jgi:hypothetical protein